MQRALLLVGLVIGGLLTAPVSLAQMDLPDRDWRVVDTTNFRVLSQLSARETEDYAAGLEQWRDVALHFILDGRSPPAAVRNHVTVFANREDFDHFFSSGESAVFIPTPRANYLVLYAPAGDALAIARHQHGHFLMRNYADLRLPRWYEEGMAAYLARLVVGDAAVIPAYTRGDYETSLMLERDMPSDKLFYDEDALASGRLIQYANRKSETLLYYLLHGYEEPGFSDRRPELNRYLEWMFEGRNQRFAYDQSFDPTTDQLDEEYQRFLLQSEPRELILTTDVPPAGRYQAANIDIDGVRVALGEISLYAGRFELARQYFETGVQGGSAMARYHSGYADSLRMQEQVDDIETLQALYIRAVELAPEDIYILLDHGEYIETVLTDCDRSLSERQQEALRQTMADIYRRALALDPRNPEANLAMAQLFLLPGQNWREGSEYQQVAYDILPADTFVMEQKIKYEILEENYQEAERLIEELSQPLHFLAEPPWVTDLRRRLESARAGEDFDACAAANGSGEEV